MISTKRFVQTYKKWLYISFSVTHLRTLVFATLTRVRIIKPLFLLTWNRCDSAQSPLPREMERIQLAFVADMSASNQFVDGDTSTLVELILSEFLTSPYNAILYGFNPMTPSGH